MNRNEVKALVKECLIEILREGAGGNSTFESQNSNRFVSKPLTPSRQVEARHQPPQRQQSQYLKEAIRREAGGNKVMESILADTAASTLPKMLQNDSRTPQPQANGLVERVVSAKSPEEIFGSETTSRWADLAFMGSKK